MPDTSRRKPQYGPLKLAEKFGLTEGEARVVLAATRKSRKAARRLARALREKFHAA